ncbi:hypothetical protein PaecuDRAFT_2625 [Paenibacillus curdlanolyticus YK9]|uniref:N-acetyltransferase domain-containing protein n=1 Tax=Paenibacillus curdlanolyticus YK9 TaxID=717606 RepID=E0IAD6_9BACL|nr:GNAT family N-acetyltransferase [Paenibacillus curdlanolyticus]EFM10713.1 hypothetical protein PaecuDRAFT_2625 [Paenibacillus curdlanolyticus YK9]
MSLPDDFRIKKLSVDDKQAIKEFDCHIKIHGTPPRTEKRLKRIHQEMNHFLQREALKEQENALNTTFLLYKGNDLAGYMSLCADSIKLQSREQRSENVPYETIPALKVARLAIHKGFQKMGLGKFLLQYAIHKALIMREEFCGIKFLTLDCFQHRLSYYTDETIGFKQNGNQSHNGDSQVPISLRLHIDNYLETKAIS